MDDVRAEVLRLAGKHLNPYKVRGKEIIAQCPYCHGDNGKQPHTFSINMETGTYVCNRKNNCGASGSIWKLREKLEGGDIYKPVQKKYSKPKTKITRPTDAISAYFAKRGIGYETLKAYRVGNDGFGKIGFSYFDEKGELTFVKHRTFPEKGFTVDADCKQIFFGMNLCEGNEQLIITEGEIDALSVYEAGIKNAVSLPIGAEKLGCIDNCIDWISKFKTFILWSDNDEAGRKNLEALIGRLGKGKCKIVDVPEKDANDTLLFRGKEAVRQAIETAKYLPCEDIVRASQINAAPVEYKRRARFGIGLLDMKMGGARMGEVTVWTGINSSGKSTVVNQVALQGIADGFRVGIYSGEFKPDRLIEWINMQAAGKENIVTVTDELTGATFYRVNESCLNEIREWYDYGLYFYDPDRKANVGEEIFTKMEYMQSRYGVEIFVIDNLMKCTIGYAEKDLYGKQTEFVSRVVDFAKDNNVHIHLIAHPRKPDSGKRITKSDIAGSFNITNLADNVIGVHRISPEEKKSESYHKKLAEKGWKNFDTVLEIFKNRFLGVQDFQICLQFEPSCKRFYSAADKYSYEQPWKRQEVQEELYADDSVYTVEF